MELFLIRHAEAVPVGENGITEDAERPLTEKGIKQADGLGKLFQRRGLTLDRIVTSPFVRARQTADAILRHASGTAPTIDVTDALTPNAKPRKLAKALRSITGERIGLVGHLPHLGILAAWLIGGKKAQIDLAKAGVAHIFCGEMPGKGLGTLDWLVTPEWFEIG